MDKQKFPDIDGLLGSIRNVATPVGQQPADDASGGNERRTQKNEYASSFATGEQDGWDAFMSHLSSYGFREKKEERKVCMIDKDLADSLDECDIDRKCRSDVINAIVRTFITLYLPRLKAYRKKNKSLLDNDKTTQL